MCDKGEDSKIEANELLECEKCEEPWHLQCLDPPLDSVPEGEWHCPQCLELVLDRSKGTTDEGKAAAAAAKNGSKKRGAEELKESKAATKKRKPPAKRP